MTTEPEIAATTSKVRSLLWSARSKKAKVGLLAGLVVTAIAASACSGATAKPDAAIKVIQVTATTEVVVIEGADSSEGAVDQWYDGIANLDLSRMWAIIDTPTKSNVSRPTWSACVQALFDITPPIDSADYDESEVYEAGGLTFSTGSITITAEGAEFTQPQTFEVVERSERWFIADGVTSNDNQSCLAKSRV